MRFARSRGRHAGLGSRCFVHAGYTAWRCIDATIKAVNRYVYLSIQVSDTLRVNSHIQANRVVILTGSARMSVEIIRSIDLRIVATVWTIGRDVRGCGEERYKYQQTAIFTK